MDIYEKAFKVGTLVKVKGMLGAFFIKEINENRNLIKLHGLEGSFQRDHIEQYSNSKKCFEVIDGARKKPCGFVGYALTRDDAEKIKGKYCKMGGFISQIWW